MIPPRPKITFRQCVKELEAEDKDAGRFLEATLIEFAKRVNNETLDGESQKLGVERTMEVMEMMWNEGKIRFDFEDDSGIIRLLTFDENTGDYS